jgi:hypothetical protein
MIDAEMMRAIPLESDRPGVETARTITSLSADTLKRNFPNLIIKLSERREGMQRGNAFKIAAGQITGPKQGGH